MKALKTVVSTIAMLLNTAAMADSCYIGQAIGGGESGRRGLVQIYNPIGSGKDLIVSSTRAMFISSKTPPQTGQDAAWFAGDLRRYDNPLMTMLDPNVSIASTNTHDATQSVARLRIENVLPRRCDASAAPPVLTDCVPSYAGYEMWTGGGWKDKPYPWDAKLIIAPGTGFLVAAAKPDAGESWNQLVTSWQWCERALP